MNKWPIEYVMFVFFNCKECNEVFYSADVLDTIDRIVQYCKAHTEEISVVDYKKSAA